MRHITICSIRHVMTVLIAAAVISICAAGFVWAAPAENSDGPVITKQPESVTVNYPEGAAFHVEVADPGSVASYRWEYTDGYHVFKLDGTSASTDTLVLPATMQDDPVGTITCIIKGKNGAETVSEPATLTIANPDEEKTVLYVGEYAVTPGETFDINKTALGSGTVMFDTNEADITMKNVKVDTTKAVFDSTLSPSPGLVLIRHNSKVTEYGLHLDGDCSVKNTFFQEESNSGGITFAAYLYPSDEEAQIPLVRIDGKGSFILSGGAYAIYADADLELDTDVVITPNGNYFCDGIICDNLYVERGCHLDLRVNGTGIESRKQMFVREGAVIDIDTMAPHVMGENTTKGALFLNDLLTIEGAQINIHGYADPDQFIPYDKTLDAFGGIIFAKYGSIEAKDSSITVDLEAVKGETDYASGFFGVVDMANKGYIVLDNSKIGVRLDSPDVMDSNGIYLKGNLIMQNGSKVSADMHNQGLVRGIAVEGKLIIKDSDADVNVSSYSGEDAYGILCDSAELDLSDEKYSIASQASGGMAFAANTGKQDKNIKKYDPAYKTTKLKFKGDTMCLVPVNSGISLASIPGSMNYIRVETFYDKADTTRPAQEVRIAKGDKPDNTLAVKGKSVKVSAKKLKKKSQTITRSKAVSVTGARGAVTYSKVSVNKKKYAKKFTVNSKTGKITVKKGVKKGTYKLTIKVKAAGDEKYKPASKTATVTIRVK